MALLKEGQQAPEIKLENQNGDEVTLSQYKGKKVILFFYPKDNTPGCTAESCNLNDNYNTLLQKGFEIIGISPDTVKSHQKFSNKFDFQYNILADIEKKTLNQYGVWGEKKMYGRTYEGVHRTTFIISEDGKIEKIITKVKTKDHTNQILEELKTN
ncbi:MAG: thioredoxin-dependent thiol peroxidase [Chlorobi bacterium]|nr:thioredoxin-dependent thiol peroxidase [Chlorobiota bacterium]